MKHTYSLVALAIVVGVTAITFPVAVQTQAGGIVTAQRPPEPGATPGVELTNISKVPHDEWTSVFPMVAVSRSNPNLVAVAWRRFPLRVGANAPNLPTECHIALSKDGGRTYTDTDLMPYLRTEGDGTEANPRLSGCNSPFAAIANDGTIYAGGSTIRTLPSPPIGRVGVSVSTDGGARWSKNVYGLTIDRLAPGLKGLNGGMSPNDVPWDGGKGLVDPQTGTFYAATRGYISASHDKGKTFGTVYAAYGTASAAFGTLLSARIETSFQGGKCPCLVVSTSTDEGKTWSRNLAAQAGDFDPVGVHLYPIASANPAKKGSYAVGVFAPDHKSVKVYYTADDGKTWKSAAPAPIPASVFFTTVNQLHTGYTNDGRILVTWRAWRNVAAHNTFVAMLDGDTFGPTIKVTPELSIDPPMTFAVYYQGDFTNWVHGNNTHAFVAFVFAPKGQNQDTWVARVPLGLLK